MGRSVTTNRLAGCCARAVLPIALGGDGGRPALAQEGNKKDITLVVGEQTSISAKNVRTYSEGVPGIIDVRVPKDGSEFVIVALKPGRPRSSSSTRTAPRPSTASRW
jgi:hypothetical protein